MNIQNIEKYSTGGTALFEIIESWKTVENDVDEVNRVNNSSCLRENDIPGASLGDRD